MRGCSVFTRPPSISGAAVTSSTRVTSRPCSSRKRRRAARRRRARSRARRARARTSSMPVLVVDRDQRAHGSPTDLLQRDGAGDLGQEPVLDRVDPLLERLAGLDRDALLRAGSGPVSTPSSTRWTVTPVVCDAGGERVLDRVRARERPAAATGGRSRSGSGKRSRNGWRQQVHVAGEHDELDAVLLEPGRHHEVALLAVGVAVEAEGRGRDAGSAGTLESVGVPPVRARPRRPAGRRRSAPAGSSPRRRRARRSRDPPDHELARRGSATTAHQPMPRLKTRRSSSSSTWRASQSKTGGRSQTSQSISRAQPVRERRG